MLFLQVPVCEMANFSAYLQSLTFSIKYIIVVVNDHRVHEVPYEHY